MLIAKHAAALEVGSYPVFIIRLSVVKALVKLMISAVTFSSINVLPGDPCLQYCNVNVLNLDQVLTTLGTALLDFRLR